MTRNITPNPLTKRDLYGLILVLLVAGALRFARLDVIQYRYDQAWLIGKTQDLITGKSFPTEGIPVSLGFPTPPTMFFVISPPYFISSNPLIAASYVIFLNLAGVAMLWLLAQRYFSRTAALVAALTYACSPWAIAFSREIWPPDFNIPFAIAGLLCGLLGFVEGRRWAQVLSLPLLLIAAGIHPNAVVLFAAYGLLVWRWRKQVSRKALALSIVIGLMTLSPYLLTFTSARIDTFQSVLSKNHTASNLSTENALTLTLRYASGAGIETAFMAASNNDRNTYTSQTPLVFWIIATIPIGVGLIVIRKHPLALFVLLWAFTGPVVLTLLRVAPASHYLLQSIPALCLLAGVGLAASVRLRPLLLSGWAVVLLIQCFLWLNFLNDVRVGALPDYGPLLVDLLPLRERLTHESDVLIVGGVTGMSGYDVWSTMLHGYTTCVRELTIADGGIAVLPNHPFTVLRAPGINALPSPYIASDSVRFPLRPDEGAYTMDNYDLAPVWSNPTLTTVAPARFDNGVILNGYRFADGRLYLDWSLPAQSTTDYQVFAHVLNANGDKVAQHDASFWPGHDWCANDRIVTWFDLQQPETAATLRIGMYRDENGKITGSNVYDDAGNAAPWVDIPLNTP